MKFNPAIVRAIMQAQLDELRRTGGTTADTPEAHYPFKPQEVEEVFFARRNESKNIWFRLKDGRDFDAHGEVPDKSVINTASEGYINPALKAMMEAWDVMDKLPLTMIPLASSTLRNATLVKNGRLETMVEVHTGKDTGSLQVRPEHIKDSFPRFATDQKVISSLATLHSYDVYSLRANLSKLGIGVDPSFLDLSDEMKAKLDRYTPEFTVPLVTTIFGSEGEGGDRQSLIRMFRGSDRAKVAERLRMMSQKTGIPVEEIPRFLEHYADTFLSVAYYQHSFESVVPQLTRCGDWLRGGRERSASGGHFKKIEEALGFLAATIRGRLKAFREAFDLFWRNMSAPAFDHLRQEVEGRAVGTGAMLCGLSVKMRHWSQAFLHAQSGGPATRLQYIVSEMEPGLLRLCEFGSKS